MVKAASTIASSCRIPRPRRYGQKIRNENLDPNTDYLAKKPEVIDKAKLK